MRKIFLLFAGLALLTQTFAISTVTAPRHKINAADVYFPVGKSGLKISLLELSRIKVKDLEKITDRKLSFADKVNFKIAQKKVRDGIDRDGTINSKKFEKLLKKQKGGETGFHFGGFALGFFLGLIGVLIAYLINDDFKHNRVKWAWIGCGIAVVLNIILLIAVFSSI